MSLPLPSRRKVLLVGWDAADWKVMHPLMDQGKLPTVQGLVERGAMGNLATLHPVLSPLLWTSIATGKRAAGHGVHGFSEPTPDGRGIRPVTNLSRTTKAVWNIFSQAGLRSNVVGWWPSHPAEPILGTMVSNHFQQAVGPPTEPWPVPPGAVHPAHLAPVLAELRLNPNELLAEHILPFIPRAAEIDQTKDQRLASCAKILAECSSVHAVATHLMQTESWDFMAVYYDAIDHFCHAFMRYHPPRQSHVSRRDFDLYHGVVEAAYRYHDMMLATLLRLAGPDVTVVLMSDHGFHPDHLRPASIPAEPAGPAIEHRDLGIFVASGPGVKQDALVHGLSLLDITPTLLHLMGLPVGEDMEGAPALDALQTPSDVVTIPSWDDLPGEAGQHPPDRELDAAESAQAIEQLVALGYIQPPDADRQRAIDQTRRELRYNLAQSLMDAHHHQAAADLLVDLYRDWPGEHRFGAQLALCYQALERAADLRAVVTLLDDRRAADEQAARAQLEQLLGELPGDASKWTAADRWRLRDLRQRAMPLRQAMDYLWGCVHFAAGQFDQAIIRLSSAEQPVSPNTDAAPASRPALPLQIGEAYLKLRRPRDAARAFLRAARIDPQNPHTWGGLARCALRTRRPRQAARLALRAIGLTYHAPLSHYTLGVALMRMRQPQQAAAALQVATQQNPNFAAAHARLARLYQLWLNDPEQAAEHFRLAQAMRKAQRAGRTAPQRFVAASRNANPNSRVEDDTPQSESEVASATISADEPPSCRAKPLGTAESIEPSAEPATGPLVIVTGLPRSGTSMVMQMLAAGGRRRCRAQGRRPDDDNPRGYFEHSNARRLASDASWLPAAAGKATKIVAQLLPHLPEGLPCRIVMIHRDLHEVLSSQAKMLKRNARQGAQLAPERLREVFSRQVSGVRDWLTDRPAPELLELHYASVLDDPANAALSIKQFVGDLHRSWPAGELDTAAMAAVVDRSLHRNRGPIRTGNW